MSHLGLLTYHWMLTQMSAESKDDVPAWQEDQNSSWNPQLRNVLYQRL